MEETLPESLSSSHSHMWYPKGAGLAFAGVLTHGTKVHLEVCLPVTVERVEDWEPELGPQLSSPDWPTDYTYTSHLLNQSLPCEKMIKRSDLLEPLWRVNETRDTGSPFVTSHLKQFQVTWPLRWGTETLVPLRRLSMSSEILWRPVNDSRSLQSFSCSKQSTETNPPNKYKKKQRLIDM